LRKFWTSPDYLSGRLSGRRTFSMKVSSLKMQFRQWTSGTVQLSPARFANRFRLSGDLHRFPGKTIFRLVAISPYCWDMRVCNNCNPHCSSFTSNARKAHTNDTSASGISAFTDSPFPRRENANCLRLNQMCFDESVFCRSASRVRLHIDVYRVVNATRYLALFTTLTGMINQSKRSVDLFRMNALNYVDVMKLMAMVIEHSRKMNVLIGSHNNLNNRMRKPERCLLSNIWSYPEFP
jgi:hypothetical protein